MIGHSNQNIPLFRLKGEPVPVVRVGDGDEGPGPLGQRPPPQLRDAVLGHDPVHVVLAGGHHRPRRQGGGDPAHRFDLRRWGDRQGRLVLTQVGDLAEVDHGPEVQHGVRVAPVSSPA